MPERQRAGEADAEKPSRTRATSLAAGEAGRDPSHRPDGSKRRAERVVAPGLYVVVTPIGNADDVTLRALATLRQADVIACEDTRVTAKLLARHGIRRPLLPYHDHNAERARPLLLARLRQGEVVALVSDAGTPLISDPGLKLVQEAVDEGLPVTTLPGPSATLAALVLSGLPSDRFLFAGFLPAKPAERRRELAELAGVPASLVFFESAQRLAAALGDMVAVLGSRRAAVARELTKRFEEVRRAPLDALAAHYAAEGPPRGEVVVVVAPAEASLPALSADALDEQLAAALARASVKDASAAVAAATGLPRRRVYARALALAGRRP
jgi:16S rRNA (cytidine1402-2'-O)-methyltransferase